jgi:hypothetical protein
MSNVPRVRIAVHHEMSQLVSGSEPMPVDVIPVVREHYYRTT